MKKTVFLSLLSLLLLVGCNNDDTASTPQNDDNGATTDTPADDTDDDAAPETGVTVGFEIGNQAPDITGADIDGVPFKLSDYRGKVVVLDFWGDW